MSSHAAQSPHLRHQFDDLQQQRASAALGMWTFLITEVMLFGGVFASYALYRFWYFPEWDLASRQLDLWLGGFNTFVLLTSSLTMAFAVDAAANGNQKALQRNILLTLLLGFVFVGVKVVEYSAKWEHHLVPGKYFEWHGDPVGDMGAFELFFVFYFIMTGIHAFHMLIAFGLLITLYIQARLGKFSAEYYTPVEMIGLYWHLVDIVWVFLFPLLYLIDRN
ncbi:cytochrome c oxidase subunit 3 [Planctomicrobium sp. SH527]|uniref:cytochrome c oxidase subunit 3 n=1 Tax=Planctomicrobium sp. SH527 TaxID=3448123 RepID=UPI003F5BAB31